MMSLNDARSLLNKAMLEQRAGRLEEVESQYLLLLSNQVEEEYVLNQLLDMSLLQKQVSKSVELMQQLVRLVPNEYRYCQDLANHYQNLNQWQLAWQPYKEYIAANDGKVSADCYYNYAFNLKQAGHYRESIKTYQVALDLNISEPEEVLLNMAVIYSENLREESKAIVLLESAYQTNPKFTPALFNLAHLYEEAGDKSPAAKKYHEVLSLEPDNFQAMARLLEVSDFSSARDKVILNVENALRNKTLDTSTVVDLLYAHGKAMNDCQEYDRAFESYTQANRIDARFANPYSKSEQAKVVEQNIRIFSERWFKQLTATSDAAPIFVCGMLRSGSTLVEQILASHSSVTAGGEREFFPRLVTSKISPYPEQITSLDGIQLRQIAEDYLIDLKSAFPDSEYITDKRPDNFMYIGLIKSLFPNAKIIYTTRNPSDNCLSIYFLRLAHRMSYATKLENIAHYYQQQQRLMRYWQSIFGQDIHEVDYDSLVVDPEHSVRSVLSFLGLRWSSDCLDFHKLANRVKTASVWQVRQPLYKSSSGRWRNYRAHLDVLKKEFERK